MHNAALRVLQMNWRYLAFDVHPDHLAEAIAGAKRMKFVGLNLTVPHKILALDLMDDLDASATEWGAVNTVQFEARAPEGAWRAISQFSGEIPEEIRAKGFNTDADAIMRAIREDLGMDLAGKSVLLLGAGGAGRVAALKLAADRVQQLFLVNRTKDKAALVASEIGRRFPNVQTEQGYPGGPVDLVINATSLGLKADDPMPMDFAAYRLVGVRAVFDMIYRPAETPLLKAARLAGCRTANGLGMLLYQGARAFEIWTGQTPPLETMREALMLNIYGTRAGI